LHIRKSLLIPHNSFYYNIHKLHTQDHQ